MFSFDFLVYFALFFVVLVVGVGGWVVVNTADTQDLEKSKVRFAAATFTGILLLIVFTAVLYFVDSTGANPTDTGQKIFDKVFTGLIPIAGGIIGYLFASKES